MKNIIVFIFLLALTQKSYADKTKLKVVSLGELIEVNASPKNGFNYSFFVYIPKNNLKKLKYILVYPNNTGSSQTDTNEQKVLTQRQTLVESYIAERSNSILLVPNFPRPLVDPPLYTHALSKSTLEIKNGPLVRIDLQLIKMLQSAKNILARKYKIKTQDKYLFSGFSASAMFVNRFTFLHPDLVAGVAIGAPGGWPLAPIELFNNQKLYYPVGLADVTNITGETIKWDKLKQVPFFFYLGDKDTNDAVVFRDSFSQSDEGLIFKNFGKTPVDRWSVAEKLYKEAGLNAQFKLYKDVGHETTPAIRKDIINFFNSLQPNLF